MDKEENLFKNHLRAQDKLDYVTGKNRPDVDCILCEIIRDSNEVKKYKLHQDALSMVCLNLYPYNPGHLMISPVKHVTDFRELSKEEILSISENVKRCQDLISELYNPIGFNVGFNQGGKLAGASIEHLHVHLVPRFRGELGYIDIIGSTRVVVEGIDTVFKKMKNLKPNFFT